MDKRFKICIVTAARSEYGLLQWLITDLEKDSDVDFSLIVTGSHLSPEQGMTINQIIHDGHKITETIEYLIGSSTDVGIAKSNGLCAVSFADAFARIRPDILVVLGDRYELLGICSTALLLNIPIAHISGGDITEGAIDNQVRNAITMLASVHFPGTQESYNNIVRMIGTSKNVFNVGEPGLETFRMTALLGRNELATSLGINPKKEWVVCTLHPETKQNVEYSMHMARNLIDSLKPHQEWEIIFTASNADLGGVEMNKYFIEVSQSNANIHFFHSLGQLKYLSIIGEAKMLIGNTSSGIVEAPYIGTPVINIGERQTGRHICSNVFCVSGESIDELRDTIAKIPAIKYSSDSYYGDGETSNKIISHLKTYLNANL